MHVDFFFFSDLLGSHSFITELNVLYMYEALKMGCTKSVDPDGEREFC